MMLAFDHLFYAHVNEAALAEKGRSSRAVMLIEIMLQKKLISWPLMVIEALLTCLLTLPIPIYSGLMRRVIVGIPGLPSFLGMYIRALYWRGILRSMESNVMIDQGALFAYPDGVELAAFCYIDKHVMFMSQITKIGRRVHIAPNVFVSGGGDFIAKDYACVATGSSIITSTEILKDGARCSGPMAPAKLRNVYRGKVNLGRDAFVGAGAVLLTEVEVGEGAVVGAGVTLAKSIGAWEVWVTPRPTLIGQRDVVIH